MGKKQKAPNPYAVAQANSQAAIQTAEAQAKLGMYNEESATGTKTYVTDPNSPSGYRIVTTYSPEQQALFAQEAALKRQLADWQSAYYTGQQGLLPQYLENEAQGLDLQGQYYDAYGRLLPEYERVAGQSLDAQSQYLDEYGQLLPQYADLEERNIALQKGYTSAATDQIGRVAGVMGTPFDLDASRSAELTDISRKMMDPLWEDREAQMRANLLARGSREGSESWATAMRPFEDQRGRAYDQMFLDAYKTANETALTERNIPMQDLALLAGLVRPGGLPQPASFGAGLPAPGATPTPQIGSAGGPGPQQWVSPNAPQPGVAPTDLGSMVYQSAGLNQQADNAKMSGLYGLGSTALGGWALNGFAGLPALGAAAGSAATGIGSALAGFLPFLSDPSAKKDAERIGTDERGRGIYMFRYLWDEAKDAMRVGFMADQVKRLTPEAATQSLTGPMMVNYGAI